MRVVRVVLGLGSNLGDRLGNILSAVERLRAVAGRGDSLASAAAAERQAIELAKAFSTEQSAAFVNGVLDAVLKEHQALTAGVPPIASPARDPKSEI